VKGYRKVGHVQRNRLFWDSVKKGTYKNVDFGRPKGKGLCLTKAGVTTQANCARSEEILPVLGEGERHTRNGKKSSLAAKGNVHRPIVTVKGKIKQRRGSKKRYEKKKNPTPVPGGNVGSTIGEKEKVCGGGREE